jgi:hypothetical protein
MNARRKILVRERWHEADNFLIVPVRYSDLPTLDALWDLEEALTQPIVLGRFVLPNSEDDVAGA